MPVLGACNSVYLTGHSVLAMVSASAHVCALILLPGMVCRDAGLSWVPEGAWDRANSPSDAGIETQPAFSEVDVLVGIAGKVVALLEAPAILGAPLAAERRRRSHPLSSFFLRAESHCPSHLLLLAVTGRRASSSCL